MNLSNKINEMINISQVGDFFGKKNISYLSFGMDDDAINFINENREKFQLLIQNAYEFDKEIENTYTLAKFQSLLIEKFNSNFIKKKNTNITEAKAFIEELKITPIKSFSVSREIFGIKASSSFENIFFCKFKIHETSKSTPEFKRKSANSKFNDLNNSNFLIEWQTNARHYEKAIEIADKYFERFELFLQFIIGRPTNRFEVGILNYQGWKNLNAYVYDESGTSSKTSENHGAYDKLPIDDIYLKNSELGHDYVWDLACMSDPNGFQTRIITAIEWLGQAISEMSTQNSFLKAAISLEIIFTFNEKTVITPSIMNQISESVALLLGKDLEQRKTLEREIKDLYGIRSSIVHAGKKNIDKSMGLKMIILARSVIRELSTNKKLKPIKTIDELHETLKEIKYSCPPI